MRLLDEIFRAVEIVLITWPGTPEQLGADLHVATRAPFGLTPESRQREVQERNEAKQRILACPGGDLLIKLEKISINAR